MKRCPTCNRTFSEENLSFCIDDGTPLVPDTADDVTVVSPSARQPEGKPASGSFGAASPAYQPPGSYVPPQRTNKRRVWPWVLGIAAVLLIGIVGLGIVAAVLLPSILKARTERDRPAINTNLPANSNDNSALNENSNASPGKENDNANANADSTAPPPTDEADVLAALTSIEHDWTVANINADKSALEKILADDYVGTTPDGKALGKAEYIRTIQRDTTTQKWDFEDLKVTLRGTRATLTGVVKFQTQAGEAAFRFTDKFVWRDGRWQAIGSEISPLGQEQPPPGQ